MTLTRRRTCKGVSNGQHKQKRTDDEDPVVARGREDT